jgi:hypothetical protein
MLRRGTEPDSRGRTPSLDPFADAPPPPEALPPGLNGWAAPASYLGLDASLIRELARAALGSPAVATLRSGELAVGAMLAALAIRGEDTVLDELLPLAGAELRLHRYAVGQLQPLAVHPVTSVGEMLRCLSHCAVQAPGETWEAVAHDGQSDPVAVAAARSHELRWLQPPAPGSANAAPWAPITTQAVAPGGSVAEWSARLANAALPAPPAVGRGPALPPPDLASLDLDLRLGPAAPPIPAPASPTSAPTAAPRAAVPPTPASPASPAPAPEPTPAFAPTPAPVLRLDAVAREELRALVRESVEQVLAAAPIELDLDPTTIDQLRDNTTLERLIEAVQILERKVASVDAIGRQVVALNAAIDDLADSNRALLRHQWDNMPPPGFWLRVQKAEDEVRRAVDDLAAEVRGRLRPPR